MHCAKTGIALQFCQSMFPAPVVGLSVQRLVEVGVQTDSRIVTPIVLVAYIGMHCNGMP